MKVCRQGSQIIKIIVIASSIFTASAQLCVCPCHCGKPASRWTGDFWCKSVLLPFSFFCRFDVVMSFEIYSGFWVFSLLHTSLLCLMGELAGGAFVDVGV